jgi:hypothetical protein
LHDILPDASELLRRVGEAREGLSYLDRSLNQLGFRGGGMSQESRLQIGVGETLCGFRWTDTLKLLHNCPIEIDGSLAGALTLLAKLKDGLGVVCLGQGSRLGNPLPGPSDDLGDETAGCRVYARGRPLLQRPKLANGLWGEFLLVVGGCPSPHHGLTRETVLDILDHRLRCTTRFRASGELGSTSTLGRSLLAEGSCLGELASLSRRDTGEE